ncbi:hypothetical protein ACRALDRAFT_206280 [Sodiomyces alcalophilus JCM 7366]|uniref:uncharacterized protein n=1 Tax=Sodiomyces alcalophilus JCM 7366 TaxID=591952 RepID=UPI0039B42E6C
MHTYLHDRCYQAGEPFVDIQMVPDGTCNHNAFEWEIQPRKRPKAAKQRSPTTGYILSEYVVQTVFRLSIATEAEEILFITVAIPPLTYICMHVDSNHGTLTGCLSDLSAPLIATVSAHTLGTLYVVWIPPSAELSPMLNPNSEISKTSLISPPTLLHNKWSGGTMYNVPTTAGPRKCSSVGDKLPQTPPSPTGKRDYETVSSMGILLVEARGSRFWSIIGDAQHLRVLCLWSSIGHTAVDNISTHALGMHIDPMTSAGGNLTASEHLTAFCKGSHPHWLVDEGRVAAWGSLREEGSPGAGGRKQKRGGVGPPGFFDTTYVVHIRTCILTQRSVSAEFQRPLHSSLSRLDNVHNYIIFTFNYLDLGVFSLEQYRLSKYS